MTSPNARRTTVFPSYEPGMRDRIEKRFDAVRQNHPTDEVIAVMASLIESHPGLPSVELLSLLSSLMRCGVRDGLLEWLHAATGSAPLILLLKVLDTSALLQVGDAWASLFDEDTRSEDMAWFLTTAYPAKELVITGFCEGMSTSDMSSLASMCHRLVDNRGGSFSLNWMVADSPEATLSGAVRMLDLWEWRIPAVWRKRLVLDWPISGRTHGGDYLSHRSLMAADVDSDARCSPVARALLLMEPEDIASHYPYGIHGEAWEQVLGTLADIDLSLPVRYWFEQAWRQCFLFNVISGDVFHPLPECSEEERERQEARFAVLCFVVFTAMRDEDGLDKEEREKGAKTRRTGLIASLWRRMHPGTISLPDEFLIQQARLAFLAARTQWEQERENAEHASSR